MAFFRKKLEKFLVVNVETERTRRQDTVDAANESVRKEAMAEHQATLTTISDRSEERRKLLDARRVAIDKMDDKALALATKRSFSPPDGFARRWKLMNELEDGDPLFALTKWAVRVLFVGLSMLVLASKSLTWAAIRTGQPSQSNRVSGPTPDRPATIAFHVEATSGPHGLTAPRPVTTTRCTLGLRGEVVVDVVDRVLHRADALGVLVRNFDVEFLLDQHHQLDDVERVCTEIVNKRT